MAFSNITEENRKAFDIIKKTTLQIRVLYLLLHSEKYLSPLKLIIIFIHFVIIYHSTFFCWQYLYVIIITDNTVGTIVVVIVWQLDLQLPVQSVPIATKVVSSNPIHGKVYSIQRYVIKFANDLRLFNGFLRVLWFPPPIRLTATM